MPKGLYNMSFFIRLLRRLGLLRSDLLIHYEQSVSDAVLDIAARENRRPEDVTLELLGDALDRRRFSSELLAQWETLTPRERQVTGLACLGYTNRQIGERLIISSETVKTHLRNVTRKFGVRRKSELQILLAHFDFSAWERINPKG